MTLVTASIAAALDEGLKWVGKTLLSPMSPW